MASKLFLFFAELKRRKVYRVAVVYVVVAAGVIGFADPALGEMWESIRVPVLALVLISFPIALVLAWAYEVRPEESPTTEPPEDSPPPPFEAASTHKVPTEAQGVSIVVLPFDNMSPDPDDAYFSDGLTEELITNLSYVHSLRVISRTSAMALKATQKDVRSIAQELDVRYVLEGSVRKAGDRLRITAQLIDGRSDTHLWAEKYDGVLEDVFGMQEQVSLSIVDALRVALNPDEEARIGTPAVDDLVAYECYLKARHQIWLLTEDSLKEATTLLEKGLEAQPNSAALHALRAFVNLQYLNMMDGSPSTYPALLEQARAWTSEALALDPNSSIAHFVQGSVHWFSENPPGATASWARAVALNPNDADALNWLSFALHASGQQLDRAKDLLDRAGKLDPLNPVNSEVAQSYPAWYRGDFRAVLDYWETWCASDSPLVRLYIGYFRAAAGEVEDAIEVFGRIQRDTPGHPGAAAGAFLSHALRGQHEQALESVTEDLELAAWWDDFTPVLMADGYLLIGEEEKALHWIERAIEMGTTNAAFLGEHEPFLRELRGNPRFELLLKKARALSEAVASDAVISHEHAPPLRPFFSRACPT